MTSGLYFSLKDIPSVLYLWVSTMASGTIDCNSSGNRDEIKVAGPHPHGSA
jgi:hypothetical protein